MTMTAYLRSSRCGWYNPRRVTNTVLEILQCRIVTFAKSEAL